jgi:hypothetical protein
MRAAVVAVCVSLAACQPVPPVAPLTPVVGPVPPATITPAATDALFAKAKRVLSRDLKDPESTRFDGLVRRVMPNARGEPTEVVCGRMNAKNSFGAYVGYRAFAYLPFSEIAAIIDERQDVADVAIVQRFCPAS